MKIETSAAELAAAQRLGRLGSWHWDSVRDETTWSLELCRIFGIDPAQKPPSYALHPQLFSPQSWEVLKRAVEKALADGDSYSLELAYFRLDGGAGGWIECRGEAIRDEAGGIVGLRGTAQEITDRRRSEQAEAEARAMRDRGLMLRTFSQSIRTSLNGVFGFAHLLKGKVEKGGAQERWVDQILAASQQIIDLMTEMESLDAPAFGGAGRRASGDSAPGTERLEKLMALIPCPILIHNREGEILHVSQALIDSTGYSRDELPTHEAWAALAYGEDDRREIAGRVADERATQAVSDGGERWVTAKSGAKLRWHLFATSALAGHGTESLVVSIGIDVTAHQRALEPDPA